MTEYPQPICMICSQARQAREGIKTLPWGVRCCIELRCYCKVCDRETVHTIPAQQVNPESKPHKQATDVHAPERVSDKVWEDNIRHHMG